jgi:hypothetical protein
MQTTTVYIGRCKDLATQSQPRKPWCDFVVGQRVVGWTTVSITDCFRAHTTRTGKWHLRRPRTEATRATAVASIVEPRP